jgi:hypothetical protein
VKPENTKKLVQSDATVAGGTFPVVRNALRSRLAPVFRLPTPLNEFFFRLTVQRFLPWFKSARLAPLRLVNEECVVANRDRNTFLSAEQQAVLCAQAAIELLLRFHLPHGKSLHLVRIDTVMEADVNHYLLARAECLAEEAIALSVNPSGRIFKGAAVVDADNRLVAKTVCEFTWR